MKTRFNLQYTIKGLFIYTLLVLNLSSALGQQLPSDTTDLTTLSLEELMKSKSKGVPSVLDEKMASAIEVASSKPMAIRKSPAILSIVTSDDIEKSGARDLIDILDAIPGFDFATDVIGVVGIGVRGNWANEGKVLLLLDGQELNEGVYGTLQFGNNFPLDNIKRIEIIRGPGSAIYGGAAEYSVINIITKSEADLSGLNVSSNLGASSNTFSRTNIGLTYAKKLKTVGLSFNAFYGNGIRSTENYSDVFGSTFDMAKNSDLKTLSFNLGLNYKTFSLKIFTFDNQTDSRDGYNMSYSTPYKEYFRTYNFELKYLIKPSAAFSLTPKFSFKRNSPFESSANQSDDTLAESEMPYHVISDRYKLNLTSIWEPTKNTNITLGAEGFYDSGQNLNGDVFRNSNKSHISYLNSALFTQAILKHRIANPIFGARFDYNSSFGSSFVPRIGLTKRIERLNFKLLFSNAFKAPAIENVESSLFGTIKPEKTSIWEFETSYQLNSSMFITLNLFDISTKNTIIYTVDTSSTNNGVPDGYINANHSGSQGYEVEYKIANQWCTVNLSYSYYTNQNKESVVSFIDPFSASRALGLSNNKLSLSSSFNVTKSFFISPSIIIHSKKSGIYAIDEEGESVFKEYPATYLVNLFIGKTSILKSHLNISLGIYNILNEKTFYIQPYNSNHAPLPGMSREILLRLNYRM